MTLSEKVLELEKELETLKTEAVPTHLILDRLIDELNGIHNWKETPNEYYEGFIAARTLVEVLEANDCGQIGGFSKGQPSVGGSQLKRLRQRVAWFTERDKK